MNTWADEAVALYAGGLTAREVGRRLGVSHQQVLAAVRAAGVEVRSGPPAPDPDRGAEAVRLYREGVGSATIARRLGVAAHTVLRDLRQAGVEVRTHPTAAAAGRVGADRRARAAELYAAGWSAKRIGTELGVSRQAVLKLLRRAGVAIRPPFRG